MLLFQKQQKLLCQGDHYRTFMYIEISETKTHTVSNNICRWVYSKSIGIYLKWRGDIWWKNLNIRYRLENLNLFWQKYCLKLMILLTALCYGFKLKCIIYNCNSINVFLRFSTYIFKILQWYSQKCFPCLSHTIYTVVLLADLLITYFVFLPNRSSIYPVKLHLTLKRFSTSFISLCLRASE